MCNSLDVIRDRYQHRFWSKVDVRGDTDCWPWLGKSHSQRGYGQFTARIDGTNVSRRAHRLAYELLVGPIPAGLEIDHLCRNVVCVNPAHLEPVTHDENMRRAAKTVDVTECVRLYVDELLGYTEIARRLGHAPVTVRRRLVLAGVAIRPPGAGSTIRNLTKRTAA